MSRRFGFRVWHKERKYLYDNVAVSAQNKVGYGSSGGRYDFESAKDAVILQYTGREDRKGKEIFEGDVLKIRGVPDPVVVKWSRKKVGFILENPKETKASKKEMAWSSGGSLKVLGNVYKKPKLLEDKKEELSG